MILLRGWSRHAAQFRALVYTEWLDPAVTDESDPFRDPP